MEPVLLTLDEKETLADGMSAAGLEFITEVDIGIDKQNRRVAMIVCRDDDGGLQGFSFRYSADKFFFDKDPCMTVKLHEVEVCRTEYRRNDGEKWRI